MTVVTVERGEQSLRESARKRALPAPTPTLFAVASPGLHT